MKTKEERQQELFRKKQASLLKKCKAGKAHILKGGYYYRSNYRGYTEFILSAGVYDAQDAHDHVVQCSYTDFIRIVPIDAPAHNASIVAEIKRLSENLINPLNK